MKLFGKKDDTTDTPTGDAPDLDNPDSGEVALGDAPEEPPAEAPGDALADAPSDALPDTPPGEEQEGGALSAPARRLAVGGGNKKKILFAALGVVVLGCLAGGAYFYFSMESGPATPIAAVTPMPHPAPAVPAKPVPPPAVASATPVLPAPAPPAPPAPAISAPAATPPGLSPAAATATTAPAPAGAVPPVVPPSLGPPPGDEANAIPLNPGAPAKAPAIAAATPAVPGAPAAASAAAVPAAPGAPKIASVTPPGIEPPADAPNQDLPMPMTEAPTAPAVAAPLAPPGAGVVPVAPIPAATPAATPPAAATPAAVAAAASGKGTKTAKPASGKGGADQPSDAEKAIVQNAAVLDQLSSPGQAQRPFSPNEAPPDQTAALKTVDQLLETQAVVRPVPPAWLTVKKEHEADDADTHLILAREALAENNNVAALQLFTELKEKYPKDKRILMGRAVALQKLGQDDAALSAYEGVLNSDPRNLEALTNMLGLLKKKDPKLAVDKLEELRESYPYNADISAQLGIACGAVGRYEDALKYLNMAEALSPGSMYIIYNKAVLYDKMGKIPQAADLYREVIRLSADGTDAGGLPLDAIKKRLAVLH